ncbi:hypothetical protein C8J57DRAFT_1185085 [Mycena rebaudengoi]|nr:hypothetical protein C8J57DRAFT_1185085 [Mycena rebaudengoi]
MSTYWDSYPNFVQNATAPLDQEFALLAAQCGWKEGGPRYRKEWIRCGKVEFNYHFGREDNKLAGWQAVCALVGTRGIPTSISQCKKTLRNGIWVNIFDLISAKRTGTRVRRHPSRVALREYTKDGKIFPKATVKTNDFLKVLLVEIF